MSTAAARYPSDLSLALSQMHTDHFLELPVKVAAESPSLLQELQVESAVARHRNGEKRPIPQISLAWDQKSFQEVFRVVWERQEPSNIVESRQLCLAIRHLARSHSFWNRKALICVGNLCTLSVFSKGRSSNKSLLIIARKISSILLCFNIKVHLRWVPSKRNWADGPSRGTGIVTVSPLPQLSYHG